MIAVIALSAFVFILQSLAWPLSPGRDAYSYFTISTIGEIQIQKVGLLSTFELR